MSKMTKILVTGGAGFIGSNFIRHIYHAYPNYKIYNLDTLTYAGNLDNLSDVEALQGDLGEEGGRYVFVKGDISDEAFLDQLFTAHQFSLVFNFAAESHVDRSFFNFSNFVRTNVEGALLLAMMVHRHGAAMVHVSTDEVYGSIPDEQGFVGESAPFAPANPYASSKAAADMLLQTFMRTYDVPVRIVRGTNNFGPYQYPEKLIPLAISNCLEGRKIPVHGTGEHLRQWIHVSDMCRGIDIVAHKGEKHGIYNIAGEHASNLEVLRRIVEIIGHKPEDYFEFVPDRPHPDMRYAIDAARLESLGWALQKRFVDELPRVVEWYSKNEAWWRKLKRKKEFTDHYQKQAQARYY